MVLVDGDYLYLDIDEIDKFVFENKNSREKETEVIRDSNGIVIQTTEVERNNKDGFINVRYDMVKEMLGILFTTGAVSEDGDLRYVQDIESLNIGSKIIFNTLQHNKFLKNKLNDNE